MMYADREISASLPTLGLHLMENAALASAMAIAAGAAGVGVGSAVNRLQDELAMVAVVRGLRDALGSAVATRV